MKGFFDVKKLRELAVRVAVFALAAVCAVFPAYAEADTAAELPGGELELLARAAASAVGEEEFAVQVSFCAMLLNRKGDGGFSDTLPGVIADILSGSPALCLSFADSHPSGRNLRAAATALRGGDPTRGALFFARSEEVGAEIRESGRLSFEFGGFAFWK